MELVNCIQFYYQAISFPLLSITINYFYAYFQTARWNTLHITGHTFGCRQNDCVEAHG